jgi:anti-sigma regulatory factor (Ser/Thr protein kinase)
VTAEAPLADPPRPDEDATSAWLLLDQPFDAGTLGQLRAAVLAHVTEAGLREDRAGDVMLAVHELAANTVRHGAGAGRLLIGARPGMLQCQVLDAGAARPDGQAGGAGASPSLWPSAEGHGLWLVRQVADQLSVGPWHGGYQVTALFTLPATATASDSPQP